MCRTRSWVQILSSHNVSAIMTPINTNHGWKIRAATKATEDLYGACPSTNIRPERWAVAMRRRGIERAYTEGRRCHDDTHIMTRKDLNPRPCSTHDKSLTILLILLYV